MQIRSLFLGLAALATIAPSVATGAPRGAALADLTVAITAPSGVYVGDPGQYAVVVANPGKQGASDVRLEIDLPPTRTSPTVHVLGDLGTYDNRCAFAGTRLTCALGSLRKGGSTTVRFTIALPQSSAPLVVAAAVSTSSAESSTTNNNDIDTAHLLHPVTPVAAGDAAHIDHCTGTALTSFFECELYPSSISSFDIAFQSGGMVAITNPPGTTYWGTWAQWPADDRLQLDFYDGASLQASFDGLAVGDGCFEGITTFHPASAYVSPYRVCLP